MRLLSRPILLIIGLLFTVVLRAQEQVEPFVFEMPAVQMQVQGPEGFVAVTADGMVTLAPQEGWPALPQASRLLVLPRGSHVTMTAVKETLMERRGIDGWVQPWGGATVKGVPPDGAAPDHKVYASECYRAGDPLELEEMGVMGDKQVFRLTVHPVAYQPADSLILTYSVSATLTIEVGSRKSEVGGVADRFLIVSRPQFREGLQPFVRWKRQEGYEVVELYADTNRRDSVKALIAPYFAEDAGRWPRYLLLVGDAAQLQAFFGTTYPEGLDGHITDLYYAEHTGDYLPDAMVGRWPVNNTAELAAVVEKTLRYEQGLGLDSNRLKRLLLVAGTENQSPAPTTTNGQVRYVSKEAKLVHPDWDTLCYRNPASSGQRDAILHDLEDGAAVLNYTAHCTVGGWSDPSVSIGAIDTLDNPQPLLYVNNCCRSNAFTGTCFGEALLRMPVGGAIGVIGATNSTLWNEDYYWAVGPKYPFCIDPQYDPQRLGAFDRWTGRDGGVLTQGELLMAGNMAVMAFGSPYDKFYWEIYCLFGDPSLRPYIGVPQPASVATTDIRNGATLLTVSGTAGATVTALQGDSLIGVGRLDAGGRCVLELSRSLDTLPLVLTATGYGLLPAVDTLTVDRNIAVGVALRDVTATDSTVNLRVENIGRQRLDSLYVVLCQRPEDTADAGALIAVQQTVVDSLLPQQSVNLTLPVVVTAHGRQCQATLSAWEEEATPLASLFCTLHAPFPRPTYSLLPLQLDSGWVSRIEALHDYLMKGTAAGAFDSLALVVSALPTGDTLICLNYPEVPEYYTLFSTPDTLTHLHLTVEMQWGRQVIRGDHYLVAGERIDSFEEGFESYPWRGGGTQGWVLDSNIRHSGRLSARSGAIDYRQTSDLVLEVYLPRKDTLSYWLKTSTEATHDKFQFYIDNERRGIEAWGESGWTLRKQVVPAGRHTLRWRYVKDEEGEAGSDCVWIDDVRLPLALWDSAYGWFGTAEPLGIEEVGGRKSEVRVYPNPTTGQVTVEGMGLLRIYDLYGREVHTTTLHSPLSTLHLEPLPDGIYLLHLNNAYGSSHQRIILHR